MTHVYCCPCGRQNRAPMKTTTACPRCERTRTYEGRGPAFTEIDVAKARAEYERDARWHQQKSSGSDIEMMPVAFAIDAMGGL